MSSNGFDIFKNGFIAPDDILCAPGAIAFIFADKLYYDKDECLSHIQLATKSPALMDRYELRLRPYTHGNVLFEKDLSGRLGSNDGKNIVAFWNEKKECYKTLSRCLNELKINKLINDTYLLSTPLTGVVPLNTQITGELSPDEQEKLDLRKKLHLLTGQAKKDAMNKLGMAYGTKMGGWNQTSQKAKILSPGQKWWAVNSEGTSMRFSKWYEAVNREYITGWDETVPSFKGKWTRTDKTPAEWATYMLEKLKTFPKDDRIQGTIGALNAFLKHGKVDFIGTTGQYSSNPDMPSPFSPN